MNKFRCALLISLVVVMAGCGGLNRNISYNRMSPEDIKYVDGMERSADGSFSISISEGKFRANKFDCRFVFSPVFYMEMVGKGIYSDNVVSVQDAYGATRFFCLGPAYISYKTRLFSQDGKVIGGMEAMGIPVLFGYQSLDFRRSNNWRFDFINVPLTDISLIGFGTKYFKFLFISYDPLRWDQ